jgi:hypothetical protein
MAETLASAAGAASRKAKSEAIKTDLRLAQAIDTTSGVSLFSHLRHLRPATKHKAK